MIAADIPDALLELYTFPEDMDFFSHLLSVLEHRVPCELSGYSYTNLITERLERTVYRGTCAERMAAIPGIQEINQSHPFRSIYTAYSHGPVLSTGDLVSQQEWLNTTLYNNAYLPLGLHHDSSVRFYTYTTCISFFFSSEEPLDEASRHFLLQLSPHLKNAYNLNTLRSPEMRDSSIFMMAVSSTGEITSSSADARRVMDSFYPLKKKTVKWDFPDEIKDWVALNLQTPEAGIYANKLLNKLRLINDNGALYLTFIHRSHGWYILLEIVPWSKDIASIATLGLTEREAEVLFWISQGKQNATISSILDIHLSTVRKHVEHIFEKLNCENRGTAALLARQALSAHQANVLQSECISCSRDDCIGCSTL